jgi:uncharacterized protein
MAQYIGMHPAIAEGIRLFNSQKFFEAHEALEALWLIEQGDGKRFLHGLIQVAAAFHHYQRKNTKGFRSLLEKGARTLSLHSEMNYGIDAEHLLKQFGPWLAAARAQTLAATPLPLPVIRIFAERSMP